MRQLDTFVRAARNGSFALTADQLGISQPAVSDHITALERHLGHKLFHRHRGTTPTLTPEGINMLQRAETLLSTSQAMCRDVSIGTEEEKVRIRLSIGSRSRDIYLKPLLARLYTELPHIELDISPALPLAQIASALEKREIDLLLYTVGRPPLRLPNIHLLENVPITMVASPETAARLECGMIRPEDLQFILPDMSTLSDHWLERQLTLAGMRPHRPIRYLGFSDVIQTMVEEGMGVSILMEEQVADALAAGRLVRFGPPMEPMRRIMARSPLAPRAAEALERLLIRQVSQRAPFG
ncbi:MAG: LysR family transcriptional regulator [Sphingomonadales bacterium]|nr:LysR family transcriptional regulator [Sphingomonadales bacterium]